MADLPPVINFLVLFAFPFTLLFVAVYGVWRQLRHRNDDIVMSLLMKSGEPIPTATLKMTELLANAIDQDLLARLRIRALSNRRTVQDEQGRNDETRNVDMSGSRSRPRLPGA